MDFGALPPEINSARMWAGPGGGPLLAAQAAWQSLAADLHGTAAGYRAVVAGMQAVWLGPSASAMAASAAGYAAWLTTIAAQAEASGAQAAAAAAAYEAAFLATVPPPVIAANRAQLGALVATNILGQNTPAIMATEALYAEMWAQDAGAMYGYAASSAAATGALPQFTPAPQTTNPAAAVPVATTPGTGGTQNALQSIWSWLTSPNDFLTALGNPDTPVGFLETYSVASASSGPWQAAGQVLALMTGLWAASAATQVMGSAANASFTPSIVGAGAASYPPVTASIGGAGTTGGGLSVPPSWAKWLPPDVSINTPAAAAPAVAEGVPGLIMPPGPLGAGAAQERDDVAAARRKYLHRPRMLPTLVN